MNEYSICDSPTLESETKDEYIKRMADTPWRMAPLSVALAEKYGLYFPGLSDPSKNAPNSWFYFVEQTIPSITHAYYEDWLKRVPSVKPSRISEVVVTFDLEWPLLPQIEKVKEDLVAKQRSMDEDGLLQPIAKRTQEIHLVNYLRLLDAEASGISYREMARVIFPYKENEHPDYLGTKAVRNGLAAARRLRDTGYRYLALKSMVRFDLSPSGFPWSQILTGGKVTE